MFFFHIAVCCPVVVDSADDPYLCRSRFRVPNRFLSERNEGIISVRQGGNIYNNNLFLYTKDIVT